MARLAEFRPILVRPVSGSASKSTSDGSETPISAHDFVGRALALIATDFGRLVLLGSLQDKLSGAYQGAFAALSFDDDALKEALLYYHRRAFESWLQRDAASKADDVFWFCHASGEKAREAAASWIVRHAECSTLVPAVAENAEKERFHADLDLALATAYIRL